MDFIVVKYIYEAGSRFKSAGEADIWRSAGKAVELVSPHHQVVVTQLSIVDKTTKELWFPLRFCNTS